MTVEPSAAPDPILPPARPLGEAPVLARGLDWVSQLPSAAAPGFVYLAGACHGVAVGGGGRDMAEAAGRLTGETAEVLAQLAGPVASDAPGDPAIDAIWTEAPAPLRVAATTAGRRVGVPAAAIFRDGPALAERRASAPPASLGLAAGPDPGAARLAALMELVERDAAAGWWLAGTAPRQLDLTAAAPAAAVLAAMRQGASLARATAFLDLASPTGLPVVCALSQDADGRGLAFGFKAATDPAAAAQGALMELLQMEIGLELARLRAARGMAAAGDRGPLARAALAPERFAAFAALPPMVPPRPVEATFEAVAAHLAAQGLAVTVADLPAAADGIAVAKVFVPGLRPLPGPGAVHPAAPGAAAPLM